MFRGEDIQSSATDYILAWPAEPEEDVDLSGLNLPPETQEFAKLLKSSWSGFLPSILQKVTWISIGFDEEKELNPMRELMNKNEYKTNKEQLLALKASIKKWVDIKTLLAAPAAAAVWAVAAAWAIPNSGAESSDAMDLRAEDVDAYFTLLTWSNDVKIHNIQAQKSIEKMNTSCTFFGKNITINKYIVPKLKEVEKEIKDADIDYSIDSLWGYNRRNISWWHSPSYHALWLALDINPAKNPFVMTSWGKIPHDMPQEFVDIFKKHGFVWWGDRWKEGRTDRYKADAMHFQFSDENYLKEEMGKDVPVKMAA